MNYWMRQRDRVMERTKAALIWEIREGAKELRYFDEMKRLRNIKNKRIEEVLMQNFQATNSDLYDRCTEERMQRAGPRSGSDSRDYL